MGEYGFSLTRILPYKDKIVDSVFIRKNMGQWKLVFLQNLRSIHWVKKKLIFILTILTIFHIETINLICIANQMTGFYIKCNTGLKWVNNHPFEGKIFSFFYCQHKIHKRFIKIRQTYLNLKYKAGKHFMLNFSFAYKWLFWT